MSILIRGMEMPLSCGYCPLKQFTLHIGDDCLVGAKETEYQKRPADCPLVEIPPHGRLIDADELVADIKGQAERLWTLDSVSERDYFIERNEKFRQAMFKAWCESLFAYLDTRPTIIKAEDGNK